MESLWYKVGCKTPPKTLKQEAFESNDAHLRRLIRLRPGQRANADDLWNYTHDLLYTEIQTPLFVYLLPFCLEAWREDLRGVSGEYGGFVEWFYLVLANQNIFEKNLTPKQGSAISEFIRKTILEEIDDQRGLSYKGARARPYRWVRALTTYGVLRPDVDHIWEPWWALDTIGRAIAAIQYITSLMYAENENPVFSPWTPNEGGGPPTLWEFEGNLYTHRWLQPNVDYLKTVLTVSRISDVLTRAVDRLAGQPEHDIAAGIRDDLPLCIQTLESRCVDLPRLLETKQQPSTLCEWSR